MKILSIIGLTILVTACVQMDPENPTGAQQIQEKAYWVNSWQRTCQGVGERLCLQVQEVNKDNQKQPDINNWQLFYAPIEGFDYQLGHLYQIKTKESQLPATQVPADASSIRYELIDILEKTDDNTIRLHDIWALTEMNGENIATPSPAQKRQPQPSLEFNLSEMKIYGSDGCNNVSWTIKVLGQQELQVEPLLSTLRACPGTMKQADAFRQTMQIVKHYELSGLKLILLDADKQSILQFKKVD